MAKKFMLRKKKGQEGADGADERVTGLGKEGEISAVIAFSTAAFQCQLLVQMCE